jgi:microcompartment protein CcmL/EutN
VFEDNQVQDYEAIAVDALGILETTGLTPALVALDVMDKTARIRVLQAELNDLYGVCIKIQGSVAAVQAAMDAGARVAEQLGGKPVVVVIASPAREAWPALSSPPEFNPLIQQNVVLLPSYEVVSATVNQKDSTVSSASGFALGLIETQGFTAVFEAIDSACKAANVEVIGKEKLGGGYVTVVIKGDVAAVKAAVEAGQSKVEGLGRLIAAHVIPRPSEAVLGLLPKS